MAKDFSRLEYDGQFFLCDYYKVSKCIYAHTLKICHVVYSSLLDRRSCQTPLTKITKTHQQCCAEQNYHYFFKIYIGPSIQLKNIGPYSANQVKANCYFCIYPPM